MTESVDPHFRNPAIDEAAWLVGGWRVELLNAEFVVEGERLAGTMTGSWLGGRAFIVLRTVFESGGPPASVQVIGRDEKTLVCETLYSDDRGVSRIYTTTLGSNLWRQERLAPFTQRFDADVDDGRQHVRGHWWKSHDWGRSWEHDFELLYTRV
jgi:hypothetical protein